MKKLFILTFGLLLMAGSLQSCKKETCPVPTKKEILTQEPWTLIKFEVYNDGTLTNTYNYSGQKVEFTMGDHYYVYDASNDIIEYGTYSFVEGDPDTITLYPEGQNQYSFTVEELTETRIIFRTGDENDYVLLYLER